MNLKVEDESISSRRAEESEVTPTRDVGGSKQVVITLFINHN